MNIIRILSLRTFSITLLIYGHSVVNTYGQNNDLTGYVKTTVLEPVPYARITLLNPDSSYFQEERTNAEGQFTFIDVPVAFYFLGVSKKGKEYFDQSISLTADDTIHVMLEDETQEGQWDIIIASPESLGGTDMGVLMPDGRIYYCHNAKDPFYFDPVTNDTVFTVGDIIGQGCVEPLQTADSVIWFVGGTLQDVYGPGTCKIKTFDPGSNTWDIKTNMLDYRWYPTVAMLPSGKFLIAGGGNLNNPQRTNTSEIYDPETGQSFFYRQSRYWK